MLFNARLISYRNSIKDDTRQTMLNVKHQAITISIFNNSNEFKNKPIIIKATKKMLDAAKSIAR